LSERVTIDSADGPVLGMAHASLKRSEVQL
jgi:hypothetical protein